MKNRKIIYIAIGIILLVGINFIPLLSFKVPRMVKYTISGIDLYCVPEDRANGEKMVSSLIERRDRLVSSLPGTNSEGIEIVMYPNHKSLHLKTFGFIGYLFPDWYIGKNTKDRVLIISPDNPGPAHTRESIEKALIHEYVHVLSDRINKNIGYWLKEGLALYLAQQIPEDEDVSSSTQRITYKEYLTQNPFKFANYGGYFMAHSYIRYLDETYGWQKVTQLLVPKATYDEVLGLDEEQTFVEWREWVKREYR
jgi:hypothetical protein